MSRMLLRSPQIAYCPVPVSFMNCGPSPALSVITTKPVRVPVAVGLNVTPNVQVNPAPKLPEQGLLTTLKSPVVATELIVSARLPTFSSVTVCAALVVPTVRAGNVSDVLERFTAGAVPLPVRFRACGLLGALSVMEICAV